MEDRQRQIDKIWRDNRWLWLLPGLVIGFLIGLPIRLGDAPTDWFISNLWPEALGMTFTVFFIDRLYSRREQRQKILGMKTQLMREARSTVNPIAVNAINEMRALGWLNGRHGLLKDCELSNANLENANLSGANLESANLWFANLQGAVLQVTSLRNAWLEAANLKGADLWQSSLENARLKNALFSETTILPDGSKWTPDVDLQCFTKSDHPDFWQPVWVRERTD